MEENYQRAHLDTGDIIDKGWELTKKHFWKFVLMTLLLWLVNDSANIVSYFSYASDVSAMGGTPALTEWMMVNASTPYTGGRWVMILILFLVTHYLTLAYCRMLNAAVDGEPVSIGTELKKSVRSYGLYLVCFIVYMLIVFLGTLCFVLPGIYLAIRFLFVPLIVANHPEVGFSEIFAHSWRITKGRFWKLFWIGIVSVGINLIGLICLGVGLLVSVSFTYLMYAYVYKLLSPFPPRKAEPVVEIVEREA